MKKLYKRASVTMYIIFIILAVIVTLIAAFAAPMGVRFNTEMYRAGEQIMLDSNESIQNIQNAEIREEVTDIVSGGLAATENNITVSNALYQYGWIMIIALVSLVIFIFTRRMVEYGQGVY